MASMAFKTTMFAIFFNYGMIIANYIGTILFRDGSPTIATSSITSIDGTNLIVGILLTAGVLALFAFSLLVPTIPFMVYFMSLNGIISTVYINQFIPACTPAIGTVASSCVPGTYEIGLPVSIFSVPITAGLLIVYYIGISEYAGRTKV